MFNRKIFTTLFLITCLSFHTFTQTKKDSFAKKDTSDNILDIHLVAGNENGIRSGVRYYFLKKYSVEFSFGISLSTFGGLGYYIYEIGFNMYPFKKNGVMCGVMGMYDYLPPQYGSPFNSYIVSPYIGILIPRNNGFMFHSRGGLNFQYKNFYKDNIKKLFVTFAFELGFAIALF